MHLNAGDALIGGTFNVYPIPQEIWSSASLPWSPKTIFTADLRGTGRSVNSATLFATVFREHLVTADRNNGGFELLVDPVGGWGNTFEDWMDWTDGTTSIEADLVDFHGGTQSCKLVIDAIASNVGVSPIASSSGQISPKSGDVVRVTLWAKGSIDGLVMQIWDNSNPLQDIVLTSKWAQYQYTVTLGDNKMWLASKASEAINASQTINLDDVTVSLPSEQLSNVSNLAVNVETSLDGYAWYSIGTYNDTRTRSFAGEVVNYLFDATTLVRLRITDLVRGNTLGRNDRIEIKAVIT